MFAAPAPLSTSKAFAAVLGLTGCASAVCALLDAHMSVAGLTMVYLVAVVLAASLLPRWAGALASVACVSALNYFFVPPRYSFRVDGAEYLLTLAVLLAVSLGLNALIASLRQRGALAEARRVQAVQLHGLGECLAVSTGGAAAVARAAAQWMRDNLGLPCAVFVDLNGPQCIGAPDDPARFHPRSALWAVENRRPLGRGCADWSDLPLWCAPFQRQAPVGAVQLMLPDGALPPDAATQAHWQALARQIGLCVERERAATLAREALESSRSEALRNALLSSLSHDLRTPLAGVLGSASTLREQDDRLTRAQRESLLLNLENLARDMTLMADNTLQWARLSQAEPQATQLEMQWESVEELLGVAVARARLRWQTPPIDLRVGRDLPPVKAEAKLLLQVLANLLDNAARHGQQPARDGQAPSPGRITVQAGRSRAGVFIAVRDQGPGLPPGDPQALFARFRQGQTAVGQAHGVGLGLSICQTIVQAHGGHIEARRCAQASEGGGHGHGAGGAEFYIELPVAFVADNASKNIATNAEELRS